MRNLQEAYDAGKAQAIEKLGAEGVNDYALVVYGLAEVMRNCGRVLVWQDLSHRWHNSLALWPADYPIYTMIERMETDLITDAKCAMDHYATSIGLEGRDLYSYFVNVAWVRIPSETLIDQRVESVIRLSVKGKHPEIRANSKKYKELHDSLLEKAYKHIREQVLLGAETIWDDLDKVWRERVETPSEDAMRFVRSLEDKAKDIVAVRPDSPSVESALKAAGKIVERVEKLRSMWDGYMRETVKMAINVGILCPYM